MVDDKPQSVTAVLDQTSYDVAVRAHRPKSPVIVMGDLERTKHRWQLTNARVHEVPTEDEGVDAEAAT